MYDLGGHTFIATTLEVDGGVHELIAISEDNNLGGQDFDQRLVDHFIQRYKKKYNKDIKDDNKALRKLKIEVEKAKRILSS